MEKMPYRESDDDKAAAKGAASPAGWRNELPVLTGDIVTLREVRASDAPSLLAHLNTEEVARFVVAPPSTVGAFEQFIALAQRLRSQGTSLCYGIVPNGVEDAVGLIQVRQLDPGFSGAEWGFALGSPFWGTGVFAEAACLAIDFVFGTLHSRRLEARAAVQNGRGNGALKKLGAVQEGILRRALFCHGLYLDQFLWTLLAEDWREAHPASSGPCH